MNTITNIQNNSTVFNFNGHELNVYTDEHGNPFFIAKEVCECLDIENVTKALYGLDDDEKLTLPIVRSGQSRAVNFIRESGLYSLVLRSNKTEAKPFKKWVTNEVLPSVRKHGAYITESKLEEIVANPDLLISLATELKKERQEKARLEVVTDQQKQELKLQAPKVQYYDEVLTSESTYTTTLIAKELGMSAMKLNKTLNDLRVQYKQGETWVLYAAHHDKKYTDTETHHYIDAHGKPQTKMLTVWTELGRRFIHELITERSTG